MRLRELTNLNENWFRVWSHAVEALQRLQKKGRLWGDEIAANARTLDIPNPHEEEKWEAIRHLVVLHSKSSTPEQTEKIENALKELLNNNPNALKWVLSQDGQDTLLAGPRTINED